MNEETQPLIPRLPPPPVSPTARQHSVNVRMNAINTGIRASLISRGLIAATTIFNLPQIIGVLWVLFIQNNWQPNVCDKPLHLWCLVYAVQILVGMTLRCGTFWQGPQGCMSRCNQLIKNGLELLGFYWFILGNMWTFKSETCAVMAPEVYRLTIGLIVINYIMICLPFVLVICMLPLLCFSLPFVLDMLQLVGPQRGIPTDEINTLPSVRYKPGMFKFEDSTCSICLNNYEDENELRILPCDREGRRHFHRPCIDNWLTINASCPVCRAPIPPHRDMLHNLV